MRRTDRVVCVASRSPGAPAEVGVEHVRCDLETGEGVDRALEGADLIYFLVHSMAEGRGFAAREDRDREFHSCRPPAGRRTRHLSGRALPDSRALSPPDEQARSRIEAHRGDGRACRPGRVVVGSGGASFDILYGLCQRLPLMIAPRWLTSLCQPVSIDDTVRCLAGAARIPVRAKWISLARTF